jgi:hypothetical protein
VPQIDWDAFQESFFDFLGHVTIVSKDEGRVRFEMYDAQRYFFDEVFAGLKQDQHIFVCGKGRQVGITTACYLFDMFYAGAVAGVQGAVVFDSSDNLRVFRELFRESIESLPPSHRLPIRGGKDNRTYMAFENGNILQYLIAGTKKGQGSLGRSRGINYCHASEVSYYGDPEAFENFKNTLSEVFPYRCYIFESTGKGYGLLYDLWEDALADNISQRPIFVTWWRKRTYSHARATPLFKKYGWTEMSVEEREATEVVRRDFGHKITLEQWAWYRHRADPRARAEEGDAIGEDERAEIMTQEHPHFPEQMFRGTGTPFILSQYLAPAEARAQKALFKAYQYHLGDDLTATRIEPTRFHNKAHLKVWQEPHPNGVYIVAGDPAYGISDDGDGFCAQVMRCYADRLVQVAEFCDRSVQPYQFAWIMLHLCGWYGNCRYILELNSSGEAVWTEMRNLKNRMEEGGLFPSGGENSLTEEERNSWRNMLSQVRQYLYHRQDSIGGGGFNYHMKTTLESKFTFMTQMADRFMLGQLDVYSVQCLKEMRTLRKDGRSIEAEVKKKDDRPLALGLGVRAYLDSEWRPLNADNRTFEREQERDALAGDSEDLSVRFMSGIMANAMAQKQRWQRDVRTRVRRGQRWNW